MREILFRGKALNGGEWVYGGIVHQTDFYGDPVDRYFIIDGTTTQDYDIDPETEVDSSTVGQFTGLFDRELKRIYDGDILSWDEKVWGCPNYELVNWDFGQLHRKSGDWFIYCTVAGNKWDNPELLK